MQRKENANPDELTKLFVEITDDLSYSRTFYAKRSVRVYLNYLSQIVFLKLNKNKKVRISKFLRFWTHGLPIEVARSWKAMLLSLSIFSGALMVGIVSTANDISYANEILGESYIEMTDENIQKGDPMGVYHRDESSAWSSFQLTRHNTQIAAFTYTSGFIAGIPPVVIMIKNGIMLGTFHYYLYHKGVLNESMWIIWIHGVLEISAIIIAGGAGLLLGGGLLFPGTYTRLQSLRISAKRSFKIALSCIFILIISGFLEGSITRFTKMPMAYKYFIVLGSLAFICFYFIAYPIYLYKTKIKPGRFVFNDDIPHVENKIVSYEKVREVGDIFNDSLSLFRQVFSNIFKGWILTGLPILLGVTGYHFFVLTSYNEELYWWVSLRNVVYGNPVDWLNFGFLLVLLTPILLNVYHALFLYRNNLKFEVLRFCKYFIFGVLKLWPIYLYALGWHLWPNPLMIFIGVIMIPFIFQYSYVGFYNDGKYLEDFKTGSKLILKSWFGSVGVFLMMLVIPLILWAVSYIFSSLSGSGTTAIIDFITGFFLEHVNPFTDELTKYANALNFMLYYVFITVIISFLVTGLVIQFHSVRERVVGMTLYKRLQDFGNKNNLFEQADEGEY